MVEFAGFASPGYVFSRRWPRRAGFPHSEIPGSKFARNSPGLIATCYVLHRLLAPRHPPNALCTLEMSSMHSHKTAPAPHAVLPFGNLQCTEAPKRDTNDIQHDMRSQSYRTDFTHTQPLDRDNKNCCAIILARPFHDVKQPECLLPN